VADRTSVSNLALGKMGESYRLTDYNEDSHPARTIRAVFDAVRKATLRRGKFNFSLKRFELTAQASTDPNYETPYPYANRFPLPAESLRMVEVLGPSEIVENYRIEGGAVLADTDGPVWVKCVVDKPEPGAWDELFVQAAAAGLAYEIADPLSGDRGRKSDCWAEFQKRTKDAGGVDAKEDPPEEPYDSSWVSARFGGSLGGPPNV
jgi:hypothetical protein